jgi:hypothetical protein
MQRKLVAGIVAILAVAASATAFAAIPDENGVIHGCYNTKSGALRVTNTSVNGPSLSCANTETGLNWDQTGPAGPQGVPGAQGAPGPKGDPGPSDAYVALAAGPYDPVVTLSLGAKVVATLNLPAGKDLVSAKAWLHIADASNNTCKLNLPNGGGFDWQDAETRGAIGIYDAPISLMRPYQSASAGQVTLTCWTDLPGVVAKNAVISAIKVGNLTTN